MDKGELSYLNLLADLGKTGYLKSYLCSPAAWWKPALSGASQEFLEYLENFMSLIPDAQEVRWLLELRLLTEYLLFSKEISQDFSELIIDRINFSGYFPGNDRQWALAGRWCAVPVLLVLSEAYVRNFIVGLVPEHSGRTLWPPWADDLMDNKAKDAVRSAALAATEISPPQTGTNLFVYPLTVANRLIQIKGDSLGLPLALGFLEVLFGDKISGKIAATGTLDKKGSVVAVGHLQEKLNHAGRQNFRALLYPAKNDPPANGKGLDVLPVSSLEEAHMFSLLYVPGKSDLLIQLPKMQTNPQLFVAGCNTLDYRWIKWASRQGKLRKVVENIVASVELFRSLTGKLEECLQKWRLEEAMALSDLITTDMLQKAIQTAPLEAFKWSTLNLSLANHRGNISDGNRWVETAETLEGRVRSSDARALAEYYNNRLVFCHNSYCFEPELPGRLNEVLKFLEKAYREQCKFGCTADETLGRIYGTIAQNYAFCGPENLKNTEHYSRLARRALGERTVNDFKQEWLRQHNYITYAYLDACRFDKAQTSLLEFLEVEKLCDGWSQPLKSSRWQHALLARFLADTKQVDGQNYLDATINRRQDLVEKNHPWQIWLFNVARISHTLGNLETACDLFIESLDLCLAEDTGPTVIVMALLPLSGLRQLGELDKINVQAAKKSIKDAARTLNPEYFQMLNEDDFTAILEIIWQQPQSLFPFTYR